MKKYQAPKSKVVHIRPCQLLCESRVSFSTQSVSEANILEMETKGQWDTSDSFWNTSW